MTITGDDQFYLPSRSFTFGNGTSYPLVRVVGLGKVEVRRSPMGRVGNHGTILPRADLLGARIIDCTIEVEGTSRSDLLTKMDALDSATAPNTTGDEVLQFQLLGTTRQVYCRPSPAEWEWNESGDTGLLVPSINVEFYCQDPRIYSASTGSVVLV